PMAISSADCIEMIRACEEAEVKLMVAYRLHFERANLDAVEQVRSGAVGDPKVFSSLFSYQVQDENIRVSSERGGGPLWDIGTYCVNAARYLFRSEPEDVLAINARSGDPGLSEVEEASPVMLRLPGGQLAT